MKKIFLAIFVLSFVAMPAVSNAGFFDFLRSNQSAQTKTSVSATTAATVYRKGDKADVVLQVQQALSAKKLYAGKISGFLGSQTEASIRAWQASNRLAVTGMLDTATINSILGRGSDDERGGGNNLPFPAPTISCNSQTAPWIKVLSPNGGETYIDGSNVEVQWETCNVPVGTTIQISQSYSGPLGNEGHTLLPYPHSTTNDGIEEVVVDTDPAKYGQYFKIRVVAGCSSDPNCYFGDDQSDNLFSIIEDGGGNCIVTTEETNPFVSNIPSTNVAPFSEAYTNLYNEMSVFRIQNPTNCQMMVNKISIVSASTDGLGFVEKADLRLKTLDDGNVFDPTNIGINYPDSNAWFTISDTIPANSYKEYSVGTSDIHYFDPYPDADNMNWGGISVGVGQVDFEIPGNSSPSWNGNTLNPTPFGPIWGPVITVQP